MSSPHANKVYLHDEQFVHVENQWIEMGGRMVDKMELMMRAWNGNEGWETDKAGYIKPLCPACYMLIAYNMLVELAERNGQDLQELKESMAKLFNEMDKTKPYTTVMKVVCPVPNNNPCEKETG